MKKIGIALALALSLPAVASAQQHPRRDDPDRHAGMMGAGMHAGMMGGMGMGMDMMAQLPGPALLLRLRESLGLDAEQVERLETLHEHARQEAHTHMEAAAEAHRQAAAALHGDAPDLAAHEAALRKAADEMIQAHLIMARAHVDAGEVLSADQRKTLATVMAAMQELRAPGEAEGGDMPHGPMHPDTGSVHRRQPDRSGS